MHALYDLKAQLIEELEKIAKKGELNSASLEVVDTLAHATKNLCKVIESCEDEEYSQRMSRRSYADGSYRDGSYGMSSRRDGMGRYAVERGRAYGDDATHKLEEMMETATDEHTRRAIQQALKTIRG